MTLGVAHKGKLSRPAIDELKAVHKGGESLRKELSSLVMKKNLEKNRGEGYGKENEAFHDKDEEGTRRFEAIHQED